MAIGALALFATNLSNASNFEFEDSFNSFRKSSIAECSRESSAFFQSRCIKQAGEMYRLYKNIKDSKSGKEVIQSCLSPVKSSQNAFYALLVCVSNRNEIAEENPLPWLSGIINKKPEMLDYWSFKCQSKASRSCFKILESEFSKFWSSYKSLNGFGEKSTKARMFLDCLPLRDDPAKWEFKLINNCVKKGIK